MSSAASAHAYLDSWLTGWAHLPPAARFMRLAVLYGINPLSEPRREEWLAFCTGPAAEERFAAACVVVRAFFDIDLYNLDAMTRAVQALVDAAKP